MTQVYFCVLFLIIFGGVYLKENAFFDTIFDIEIQYNYTTVQKVLVHFKVLMAVYVKSCILHAFDPIVLNKTTVYFHEIFKRHCLCFKVFQLHHSIRKRLAIKFF